MRRGKKKEGGYGKKKNEARTKNKEGNKKKVVKFTLLSTEMDCLWFLLCGHNPECKKHFFFDVPN